MYNIYTYIYTYNVHYIYIYIYIYLYKYLCMGDSYYITHSIRDILNMKHGK